MNLKIVAEDTGDLGKFDILGNLPKEICYKILCYLTPKDVTNSFRCCKTWQQHINYNFVWKQIYEGVYSDSEEEPQTEVYKKFVQSYSSHWHGRFMYNRALRYNIKNDTYEDVDIKIKHRTDLRFIHMDDRRIILASRYTFFFVNASTGLIERRIPFTNFHRAIKHGDYLIAVKENGDFKAWNIEDGTVFIDRRLMEIAESDYTVVALLAFKHLIIFVTMEVYVLDMRTGDFRHIGAGIYACCNHDLVAILEHNGNIVIKDTDLNGVTSLNCSQPDQILNMRMNEDFLVKDYIDLDFNHLLSIFNIKTKAQFNMHHVFGDFQILKNRLVFQNDFKTFAIWDMFTQNCLFEIDNNGYNILALTLHDNYIYIKSDVLNWQIWCLQTGEFVQDSSLIFTQADIIAITNSKLLNKWSIGRDDYWEIHDFEVNLLEQNK